LNAFPNIIIRTENILNEKSLSLKSALDEICKLLKAKIYYFNWVGFYFANHKKKELILKSYAGIKTDHTIIPFGKGICGQVAVSNKNFIVPNVDVQDNYISCNINVKSEVVIPIFLNGNNIGQIDVDSNLIDPFTKKDIELLEAICEKVSIKMKKYIIYELN